MQRREGFILRPTYDQLRENIAEVIKDERYRSSIPGSAAEAGLTEDEWTADRILAGIKESRFFVME